MKFLTFHLMYLILVVGLGASAVSGFNKTISNLNQTTVCSQNTTSVKPRGKTRPRAYTVARINKCPPPSDVCVEADLPSSATVFDRSWRYDGSDRSKTPRDYYLECMDPLTRKYYTVSGKCEEDEICFDSWYEYGVASCIARPRSIALLPSNEKKSIRRKRLRPLGHQDGEIAYVEIILSEYQTPQTPGAWFPVGRFYKAKYIIAEPQTLSGEIVGKPFLVHDADSLVIAIGPPSQKDVCIELTVGTQSSLDKVSVWADFVQGSNLRALPSS